MMDRYRAGLADLRDRYDVRTAWEPGGERGYLAAPDEERAAALNRVLHDPNIEAIFCVRGGYGCLRLLDRIELPDADRRPPLLIGYSDVTALHLSFCARRGWTGLSGPVVTEWPQMTPDSPEYAAREHLEAWLAGDTPALAPFNGTSLTPHTPGNGTGPLLGGNLSVLSRLVGTRHCPDFTGSVLFLEDVQEEPYQIDRKLAHLQLAGLLDNLAGVVLGSFSTPDLDSDKPTLSLPEIVADYFADRPYPVATGLAYGHLLPRVTVPVGLRARLRVGDDEATLEATEPLAS
jgi:muramoyltetrapeptide carboxypeptidase